MGNNFTPAWIKKGFFNESLFCDDFLSTHQLLYSNGAFFTPEGRVTDTMNLRCEIFDMLRDHIGANIAKRVSNVVDVLKLAAEAEGILLWAFEGLQRLVKNGFQFTESDRAKHNRELVKRDNNNVFDFLESEGYIRLKADACTSSKELYEVYKMWCEENSLNAIKARGFSDALIANQRKYNLESTNNIVNSSGRRVRGFVGIEALVQPDLTPNGWRA